MEAFVRGETPALPGGKSMPAPGDVIAEKYRIEAVIGRGGMSVVYRATHLQLEQQVAIKVLAAEALLLPEYVVRLKREARAVSRIRSEHVVRVHDIGELPNGGVPYLVMECLTGLDLAAVLAHRGPFPVDLAVECIMQACEALAEAHALGIVHRDLKPANLFLTEALDGSPSVKVLDFGISRMSRRHGLSSLTDPGIVLGTPSYMAPEQMEAADTVDARSDIWALGAILHELLVGNPPYAGESLPQIFLKIMRSKAPRPSSCRKDVPSGIDRIVARCLRIESEDRFQSVAELAWALSRVGTPHARDSAARISRVFEKQNAASAAAPRTLRSTVPPAVVGVLPLTGRKARSPRKLAATFATAALLGAASMFGVLAARGALEARERELARAAPARTVPAAATVPDDAAVVISPVLRGLDRPSQPSPRPPSATRSAVVAVVLPQHAAKAAPPMVPGARDGGGATTRAIAAIPGAPAREGVPPRAQHD
jgi:serine/threonine-protein kinase